MQVLEAPRSNGELLSERVFYLCSDESMTTSREVYSLVGKGDRVVFEVYAMGMVEVIVAICGCAYCSS